MNVMELKSWTIFFLVVAVQGLLVGILLLLRSKSWNSTSIHLSILIFSFSIAIAIWVGFWNNWQQTFLGLNYSYNPIGFLFGPAIYLHVRAVHGKTKLINYLHYLPFICILTYLAPYYLMPPAEKIEYIIKNIEDPNFVIRHSRNLQYVSVMVYCILLLTFKSEDPKKQSWIKTIKMFFLLFSLSYLVTFPFSGLYIDIICSILMSISIYSIGYLSFNRMSIFKRLDLSNPNKYHRSGLTKQYAELIVNELHSYLKNDKAFTSSGITLGEVANKIEVPKHYISESLNKYKDISFTDFLNGMRVKEAKNMLKSSEFENLKVESVGYAVGFNSKTTFYNAFKKETGKSPAYYQKENKVVY